MYRNMINMPYPNPEIEKAFPDPVLRGAQFAPFAALTGHEEAISETARLTDGKIVLSESEQEEINRTLQYLFEHLSEQVNISVTYYIPDTKKQGGAYVTVRGILKKIRTSDRRLILSEGTEIFISDIVSLEITE